MNYRKVLAVALAASMLVPAGNVLQQILNLQTSHSGPIRSETGAMQLL